MDLNTEHPNGGFVSSEEKENKHPLVSRVVGWLGFPGGSVTPCKQVVSRLPPHRGSFGSLGVFAKVTSKAPMATKLLAGECIASIPYPDTNTNPLDTTYTLR